MNLERLRHRFFPVSSSGKNSEFDTGSRVNEIDLLRFAAAFAVVLFHFTFRGHAADGLSTFSYPPLVPIAKYGFLGVQLFYMISGFVILMTASRGGLRKFAISRFIRLYPAFWACSTLTYLATLWFGAPVFTATFPQYAVNLTMLSDFLGVASIDGSYWSLFVELRFYALVAVVLLLGKIRHAEAMFVLWMALKIILSVFPIAALRYAFIVDDAPYFIAGATLFLIWSRGISPLRSGMLLLCWVLALRQAFASAHALSIVYQTTLSRSIVAVIITSFFLALLLIALRRTGTLGSMRWMTLGALTYPLYLVHQNIGYMIFNKWYPGTNPTLLLGGIILFVMGLAYGVNVYVEKKLAPRLKTLLDRLLGVSTAKPV